MATWWAPRWRLRAPSSGMFDLIVTARVAHVCCHVLRFCSGTGKPGTPPEHDQQPDSHKKQKRTRTEDPFFRRRTRHVEAAWVRQEHQEHYSVHDVEAHRVSGNHQHTP